MGLSRGSEQTTEVIGGGGGGRRKLLDSVEAQKESLLECIFERGQDRSLRRDA